jgi:MaoC like domain
MPVSSRYVLSQGPMLEALAKTAARAITQRFAAGGGNAQRVGQPSAELTRTLPAPSDDLLDAYVAHVGGDPRAYRGRVPAHLFPHWVMPVAADTLKDLPYPITRVLNGGCRMQVNQLMPRGEPIEVRAQLTHVDDDGRRAVLTQHVVSGTRSAPDALVVDIYAIVPLSGGSKDKSKAKSADKPRVPVQAREILRARLPADAGLSFAKLTGDFNPIHWLPVAAHAAGFRNVILHGFGTLARTCEALNRGLWSGDVSRLSVLDVKFTRPLVLPHSIGFYVSGQPASEICVGDAPGGPAYMTGRFETKTARDV